MPNKNNPLYRILIIDRNSIFGTAFASLLKRSGYQVDLADRLEDGLTHYQVNPPDLILIGVDVDDPTPFFEAIRSLDGAKFIVLLSRETPRPNCLPEILQAVKGHPVFYKPFRTEEVLAAIYAALVPQEA